MSAPFRIKRPDVKLRTGASKQREEINSYLERLLKMIPAEVIGLYLVGSGVIPPGQSVALLVWSIICLVGVVVVRAYGTADHEQGKPTDWTHVAISSVSFCIWVYNLGGPFAAFGIYQPFIGSLLVLTWTFFVPLFYKGPPEQVVPRGAAGLAGPGARERTV